MTPPKAGFIELGLLGAAMVGRLKDGVKYMPASMRILSAEVLRKLRAVIFDNQSRITTVGPA
jgi:hypothetical protein